MAHRADSEGRKNRWSKGGAYSSKSYICKQLVVLLHDATNRMPSKDIVILPYMIYLHVISNHLIYLHHLHYVARLMARRVGEKLCQELETFFAGRLTFWPVTRWWSFWSELSISSNITGLPSWSFKNRNDQLERFTFCLVRNDDQFHLVIIRMNSVLRSEASFAECLTFWPVTDLRGIWSRDL